MNKTEYLLSCIGEEAGEISQAVGKCLRFGLFDGNPNNKFIGNVVGLIQETNDLIALVELLGTHGIDISKLNDPDIIETKKLKFEHFRDYSVRLGTCDE